jgi:hypothetical protein
LAHFAASVSAIVGGLVLVVSRPCPRCSRGAGHRSVESEQRSADGVRQ